MAKTKHRLGRRPDPAGAVRVPTGRGCSPMSQTKPSAPRRSGVQQIIRRRAWIWAVTGELHDRSGASTIEYQNESE